MLLGLVAVAVIAVYVVTGTDWGRERVRRKAQSMIASMVHGNVKIGRLSGNLLIGMTVHDFSITDTSGAPFAAVESFTATYSIVSLLRKHVWIEDAVIVRPLIVLDRPPNGKWNWQRIIRRDTTKRSTPHKIAWGDWVRFSDARVVNGQLIVRTPWKPSAAPPRTSSRCAASSFSKSWSYRRC
jgi:uncharacterized protein involved in outer membrane biogenesis